MGIIIMYSCYGEMAHPTCMWPYEYGIYVLSILYVNVIRIVYNISWQDLVHWCLFMCGCVCVFWSPECQTYYCIMNGYLIIVCGGVIFNSWIPTPPPHLQAVYFALLYSGCPVVYLMTNMHALIQGTRSYISTCKYFPTQIQHQTTLIQEKTKYRH